MATSEFTLDDDNFDDAFFEEIDKLATSSNDKQHQQQPQQQQQHYFNSKPSSSFHPTPQSNPQPLIHSPPRQLSQRNPNLSHSSVTTSSFSDQHLEVERLKTELSCVSKELLDLRQECAELKKQKEKDQQFKNVLHSNKKLKTCSNSQESQDYGANGISLKRKNVNATADNRPLKMVVEKKSTGIQTDNGKDESLNPSTSGTTSTHGELSSLRSIWSPLSSHRSQRNFVAKLIEACASDFCALFDCLGLNKISKIDTNCLTKVTDTSCLPKVIDTDSLTKVSELCSVLAKLADDMIHIKAFVEALLDLCNLENALVVRRSLHILRIALDHMLSIDRTSPKRDNVKVKSCNSGSDAVHIYDSEVGKSGSVHDVSGDDASHTSLITACKNICTAESETLSFLCHVDWLHMFTSMRKIAIKLTEESARVEAVSIMNLILMRIDPYSARAKFGGSLVFEAVALLLRKESGFFCRKEAVRLLYLLLNCPNILASFCSGCKKDHSQTESSNDGAITLACPASCAVLEELAECVVSSKYAAKELNNLNLRRNAVLVLSFLASSGKCGFESFLFHKLPKKANFLGLVLLVLVAEINAEALESCPASDITKERTLLMKEALILLNRLASHPAYSALVLQVLTSCRGMVSMAIDIAARLPKKSRRLLNSDSITRQMREYEVVELACIFRKKVFTFLGKSVSS